MVSPFLRPFAAAAGLVVAGLVVSPPAARAAYATYTATQGGSALAGQTYSTFDGRTLGNTDQSTTNGVSVAFGGGGAFVQGNSGGQYSAPVFSGNNNQYFYPNAGTATTPPTGADMTTYVSTGVGSATMTFSNGTGNTYFGLLWGSVDSFNSLTFTFADGTSQVITGATMNGITADAGLTYYVNFTASAGIASVQASSTQASFEFDNVAYGTGAVPEPSSMALCGIAGAAGLVIARVRRARTGA